MWKLLALFCLMATQARCVEDSSLFGEYKLIYTWPKREWSVTNCNPVVISKADPSISLDSCKCNRKSANLALANIDAVAISINFLIDYVYSMDELKQAVDDQCSCSDKSIYHDVVWRVNDNYSVHYDTDNSKISLLGKVVPSADDLKGLVDGFYWKDREGVKVCQ